jgi:hypothetical protein
MRKLDELTVPGNPQYDAIIRAINDVMQSAAKMPLNPGSAVRYGFLTPEVQAKLVSLQSLLAAYSGPGIQKA